MTEKGQILQDLDICFFKFWLFRKIFLRLFQQMWCDTRVLCHKVNPYQTQTNVDLQKYDRIKFSSYYQAGGGAD